MGWNALTALVIVFGLFAIANRIGEIFKECLNGYFLYSTNLKKQTTFEEIAEEFTDSLHLHTQEVRKTLDKVTQEFEDYKKKVDALTLRAGFKL